MSSQGKLPRVLAQVLRTSEWKDPGPDGLRSALGGVEEESELELSPSLEAMQRLSRALDEGGYVDDPEFCMVRDRSDQVSEDDPRLVWSDAVFIAASKYPGDDVFVAVDASTPERARTVLFFDWTREAPNRWTAVTSLESFVGAIMAYSRAG
jgi:hypothetical protein